MRGVGVALSPMILCCDFRAANSTKSSLREFEWDLAQMTFVTEADKQLLVGWVNQLNIPVYTPLNITAKGKGTAAAPPGMNGAAFA